MILESLLLLIDFFLSLSPQPFRVKKTLLITLYFFDFLFFIINKIFEMSNHSFDKIIQGSVFLLKTYAMNVPIQEQIKLKDLVQPLKLLRLENLGLEKAAKITAGIGIRNIFKKGGLRISLYYLPKGEIMKMHNHPSMLGTLHADICSPLEDCITFEREQQDWTSGHVAYIDGLRTNNKNLHELKALEDTYFIDVIFPDYDEERDCQSYEIQEEISERTCKLREAEDSQVDWYQI